MWANLMEHYWSIALVCWVITIICMWYVTNADIEDQVHPGMTVMSLIPVVNVIMACILLTVVACYAVLGAAKLPEKPKEKPKKKSRYS